MAKKKSSLNKILLWIAITILIIATVLFIIGSFKTGNSILGGIFLSPAKSECIAFTDDFSLNLGSDLSNKEQISLNDCYKLITAHDKRIIDNFCSNSVSLQNIKIKWNGSVIGNLALNCLDAQLEDNSPVSLSGELSIVIKEDLVKGNFENDYAIIDSNSKELIELKIKDKSSEKQFLDEYISGDIVKIRGYAKLKNAGKKVKGISEYILETNSLDNGSIQLLSDISLSPIPVQDERTIITVIINFLDRTNSRSANYLDSVMFKEGNSVDDLYRKASFGKIGFAKDASMDGISDIYGPITVNYSLSQGCDYYGWAYDAEAQLRARGIDLTKYRHRLFVLPDNYICSWIGIANVGCGSVCRAWVAYDSADVYAHELGHNIGFYHAGTDTNNDGVLENTYGDQSDIMGYSEGLREWNSPHKAQFSWVPSSEEVVISSDGTYTISATELNPTTSPYPNAAKIVKSILFTGPNYYYISFRAPIGYDSILSTTYKNKLNIHTFSGSGYTYFIKALSPGQIFSDLNNSISITYISNTADSATFSVSSSGPTCVKTAPSVSITPAKNYIAPGGTSSYMVTVVDNDNPYCGSTQFAISASAIAGVSEALSQNVLTLSPGTSGTTILTMSADVITDGDYGFTATATDSSDAAHKGSGSGILTIDSIPPSTPTNLAVSLSRKNKASLTWIASNDNNLGIITYFIYRNNINIATTTSNSYTDSPDTSIQNTYYIIAKDASGNPSAQSNSATLSGSGGTTYQCSDSKDNDKDGLCDYNGCYLRNGRNKVLVGADPQCTGPTDNSESN